MNSLTLSGRLTKDPELKTIKGANGETSLCDFSLAVTDASIKNKEGKPETYFFDCVAFGAPAINLCKYQKKGSLIGITGKLQQQRFQTKEGANRSSVRVNVNSIDFLAKAPETESNENINNTSAGEDVPTVSVPEPVEKEANTFEKAPENVDGKNTVGNTSTKYGMKDFF